MSDPTFMADPTRLVIAAIVGIALLLALIIKFKLHPVLSMMVSALAIGIGAGMPLDLVADTVTKGVGTTLQNIALLIGLGSMFGQILEESGAPRRLPRPSSIPLDRVIPAGRWALPVWLSALRCSLRPAWSF